MHGDRRGRPPGGGQSQVHEDLLVALQETLNNKAASEITLKEVAERAGTSREMIRYYFGGKDGMIAALLRNSIDRISLDLAELERTILDLDGNSTRNLVCHLNKVFIGQRKMSRISALEFTKEHSVIGDDFLRKRSDVIILHISRIIEVLRDSGIYKSEINVKNTSLNIMTLISGPVILLSSLTEDWVNLDKLNSYEWIDHLTSVIDSICRPAR